MLIKPKRNAQKADRNVADVTIRSAKPPDPQQTHRAHQSRSAEAAPAGRPRSSSSELELEEEHVDLGVHEEQRPTAPAYTKKQCGGCGCWVFAGAQKQRTRFCPFKHRNSRCLKAPGRRFGTRCPSSGPRQNDYGPGKMITAHVFRLKIFSDPPSSRNEASR